ncbi:MAG: hypothetical protein CFH12_00981, partial [Alphaproteobacteria bacterium MarineAlpha5_Bin2]
MKKKLVYTLASIVVIFVFVYFGIGFYLAYTILRIDPTCGLHEGSLPNTWSTKADHHEYSVLAQSELRKNFLSVGGMRLAGIPLSLATSVLLARLLGPEGFGYYSFAMALVPLLAIPVSSGLQQLATRQVVSYRLAEQFSLA